MRLGTSKDRNQIKEGCLGRRGVCVWGGGGGGEGEDEEKLRGKTMTTARMHDLKLPYVAAVVITTITASRLTTSSSSSSSSSR